MHSLPIKLATKRSQEWVYLWSLALFKLSIGSSLIALGWDSMALEGDKYLNIAIVTVLTFIPAAFAKPIADKIRNQSEQTIIFRALSLCALLALGIPLITETSKPLLAVWLLTYWTIIFLVENYFEQWFVTVSKEKSIAKANQLSSKSMFVIQVSTISGPIVVALTRSLNLVNSYFLIALMLTAGCLIAKKSKSTSSIKNKSVFDSTTYSIKELSVTEWSLVLSLAMIWPAVAVSNMVFPVFGKTFFSNSFNSAAFLEAILGLGMGLAGYLTASATRFLLNKKSMNKIITIVIVLSSLLFSVSQNNLILLAICTASIGIAFGHIRIEIRTRIADRLMPTKAGYIVTLANSLSAVLVTLFLMLTLMEFKSPLVLFSGALSPHFALPLTYVIAFLMLLFSISRLRDRENNETA